MIRPVIGEIFGKYMEIPQGETTRFIRYLGCSVIMCTKGCDSDYLVTHILEYEGNKPVKSCKQLVDENVTWCGGKPPGTRLCGRDFSINFTFKETVPYHANRTEGTNDLLKILQYGRWKGDEINSGRCFDSCKGYRKGDEGWLYSYSSIVHGHTEPVVLLCLDPRFDIIFNTFTECKEQSESGSLWIDENYVNVPGNCLISGTYNFMDRNMPIIDECTFPANKEIKIWAEDIEGGPFWCQDVFGFACISADCQGWVPGSTYNACPRIIIS